MTTCDFDESHDRVRLTEVARLVPKGENGSPYLDLLAEMACSHLRQDMVLFNLRLTDTVLFVGRSGAGEMLRELTGVPVEWMRGEDIDDTEGSPDVPDGSVSGCPSSFFRAEGMASYAAVAITAQENAVVGSCYTFSGDPVGLDAARMQDLRGLARLALAVLEAPVVTSARSERTRLLRCQG